MNSVNKFRILHTNINSINKNYEELVACIETVNKKLDIICCTETWNVKSLEMYNIRGYQCYYNAGNLNQADGVIIYIKEGIDVTKTKRKIFY